MAKKQVTDTVLNFVAWFTGVVVSLAVGFGLTERVLTLPNWLGGATAGGVLISQLVGWIVIITTIVGAVLAILKK